MPLKKLKLPQPGDKVFVVNDTTFAVTQETVKDCPGEGVWITRKVGAGGPIYVGLNRWAATLIEVNEKALDLATNKRAELTDRLAALDSVIKKLGGSK